MDISVIVPRAGNCPHRERAWEWLRGHLEAFDVVEGWGDPDRWCKAEAVADALSRATGDLLVIHDADVWADNLHLAIEAIESGEYQWASPHRIVRRLTEAGTEAFINGERDDLEVEEKHGAKEGGGIVVLHRDTYEEVPLDPRFVSWGQEDESWAKALRVLAGEPHIGTDTLTHLWHPPQRRQSRQIGSPESKALRDRYRVAYRKRRTNPDLMRALLDEVAHGEAVSTR